MERALGSKRARAPDESRSGSISDVDGNQDFGGGGKRRRTEEGLPPRRHSGGKSLEQQEEEKRQLRAARDVAINAVVTSMLDRTILANPAIEALRRYEMLELQSLLRTLCVEEGLRHEPFLSFQRWYFVRKMVEKAPRDPLLPCDVEVEQGLKHELQEVGLPERRAERVCLRLAEAGTAACDRVAAEQRRRRGDGVPTSAVTISDNGDGRCQVTLGRPGADRADCRLYLNKDKLERLRAEYKGPPDAFESQIFCLLARYDALKGAGYQAALPDVLFSLLADKLGVAHECFASPFNHSLSSYCSAFPDIDHLFGSSGSFFELEPATGSFEANPPFVEEVMAVLAAKIERWLTASAQPLSFVVVVPGWTDTPACVRLSQSPYLQCHLSFDRGRHTYKEGFQHTLTRQYKTAECSTFIYILQNAAGAEKWPVGGTLPDAIRAAFAPEASQ